MANEPPIPPDDPDDALEFDEEEFRGLLAEAHEMGVHYSGRDIHELRAYIGLARAEHGAEHPVACYGVSHDPTDRACRICSLRSACAAKDTSPRVEVMGVDRSLEDVPCESCGRGLLSEELLDKDSRELLDFKCTTLGCDNTLGAQCGWTEGMTRAPTISVDLPAEPDPSDEAVPPNGSEEDPAPAGSKKPDLRVVSGGKDKKAPTKPKKAAKAKPKKAAKAKPEPPGPPPDPNAFTPKAEGLAFRLGDQVFDSLTAVAREITGGRNWSGFKFFKVQPSELEPGMALERKWKEGTVIVTVEVARG